MLGHVRGHHQAVSHRFVGDSLGRSPSHGCRATEVGVDQNLVLDGSIKTFLLRVIQLQRWVIQSGIDWFPRWNPRLSRGCRGREGLGSGNVSVLTTALSPDRIPLCDVKISTVCFMQDRSPVKVAQY